MITARIRLRIKYEPKVIWSMKNVMAMLDSPESMRLNIYWDQPSRVMVSKIDVIAVIKLLLFIVL
jgi:hypothetical protein